jgi:tRNA pseudouridine38-40 synthase
VQHLRFIARRRCFAIVIQADGFLYNMVRTIAGTLLALGRGKLDEDSIRRALQTGEREHAGPTAPAEGLYLVSVQYAGSVFQGQGSGDYARPGVFV